MTKSRSRPASLPNPLSTLIGREEEIEAIQGMVADGVRLITLTGPGGVGKTRLAIAVASELSLDFDGEIAFASLAPISDARLVLPTIARVLNVSESTSDVVLDDLTQHLQGRRTALFLDNVEHVLDAARDIAALLQACPDLIVLATGREPMRLQGEHEFLVQPLKLPAAALDDSPALELFVTRAQQTVGNFDLEGQNRATLVDICRRLDGLPLALELAAARLRALSPDELLVRLDEPLSVLTGGPRDAPSRQQTMRATIQWSFDLLDSSEQRLFCQLSVFAGGGTLEAIEAVAATDSTLEDLISLVEKGLVRREESPSGEARCSMLEPVRQFALERLTSDGELEVVRQRHAEYYASNLGGLRQRIDGPNAHVEMARTDRELDNIRAALDWLREFGPVDTGLQIIGDLHVYWFQRGHVREGIDQARSLLEASETEMPTQSRGWTFQALAWFLRFQGLEREAIAPAHESFEIGRAVGDLELEARGLFTLGTCHRVLGKFDCALRWWDLALPAFYKLGDDPMIVRVHCQTGTLLAKRGDLDSARTTVELGLAVAREGELGLALALALNVLGHIELAAGELTKALEYLRESLPIYRDLGSIWAICEVLRAFAEIARQRDELDYSVALHTVSRSLPNLSGSDAGSNIHTFGTNDALDSLRTRMSATRYESAIARGQQMSIDEAVRIALSVGDGHPDEAEGPPGGLTPREVEVLKLVAAGRSNREVAAELYVGVRTVERHIANIYNKITVHNRTEAARFAFAHGLVEAEIT